MTFRERIADWISGGALSSARLRNDLMQREDDRLWAKFRDASIAAMRRKARLDRIAAEEKPTSNATVKRMARIARGEE